MDIEIKKGNFEQMGVVRDRNAAIFTFAGEKEDDCTLVLIDKETEAVTKIAVPQAYCLGSVRSIAVSGLRISDYYYYYEINGREVLDDYAPVISGREIWNDKSRKEHDYRVYGSVLDDSFVWKDDQSPEIPGRKMVMYKLHVRGFTMDRGAGASVAGTFRAVEQKIPYLQQLGVTTVELMPVYEFEEMPVPIRRDPPDYVSWQEKVEDLIPQLKKEVPPRHLNFWGYGPGNYFAVKASYAKNPARASSEFKRLIRALHTAGMECVMEMFFPRETNQNLILDALRYWVREYHVDGFHLLGELLPMTAIVQDVILSRTKIFYVDVHAKEQLQRRYEHLYVYKEEYQYPARKILNHINADMREFLDQQRKQGDDYGYVNFVASNNGFSLADVFMYKDKHNEDNGEHNTDGDPWNFSSNYGVEGPSRRKYILASRRRQWRNAMIMLFLAQGVPLIWSGDEFGNSQNGNNNAYCQDNPIGWINWKKTREASGCRDFICALTRFRREHPVIAQEKPFKFSDYKTYGFPDLSYHGDNAWISQVNLGRMNIGLLYNGAYAPENANNDDVYVAYNFYTSPISLALPKLTGSRRWYLAIDSADETDGWIDGEKPHEQQKYVDVKPQSIRVLVGR